MHAYSPAGPHQPKAHARRWLQRESAHVTSSSDVQDLSSLMMAGDMRMPVRGKHMLVSCRSTALSQGLLVIQPGAPSSCILISEHGKESPSTSRYALGAAGRHCCGPFEK